jgi:RNA polymerase sigma factor (sigma-70 family)
VIASILPFRPRRAFSQGATRAPESDHTRQFRDLILPHLDSAYSFARYLARDATAAEDIVQDAFLRAYRALPNYRGGSPKAWLFAIVRNSFLDWAAARGAAGTTGLDDGALTQIADSDQQTPEEVLLRQGDIDTVRAVIENLPEPFRETLVLRELEELSYKEIAVLTAAPIGTVMSRLARARQMLCAMLLPDGQASVPDLKETQP